MPYIFTSERLGFRNWKDSDFDPFFDMNDDSAVMEYFPNKLNREESDSMIERLQKEYETNGITFYAVDELDSGQFIGMIGLIKMKIDVAFAPCIEIGWRLKKSAWNIGYATEGAKRCIEYGFDVKFFDKIYSITSVINEKSAYIMKKIGMHQVGIFNHPRLMDGDKLKPHVYYVIEKD